MVGLMLSETSTSKLQVAVFEAPSVAVNTIVVVPVSTTVPWCWYLANRYFGTIICCCCQGGIIRQCKITALHLLYLLGLQDRLLLD